MNKGAAVNNGTRTAATKATKTAKAAKAPNGAGKGRGRKATKLSPLALAMAEDGFEGKKAALYLKNALGVSRSRAYDLLAGRADLDEGQAKALAPFFGKDGLLKLRRSTWRRVLGEAESIVRELGNTRLASSIASFAKRSIGEKRAASCS